MTKNSMDYHEILNCLITVDKISNEEIGNFDDRLRQILHKTQSKLINIDKQFMTDYNECENESSDIRYQYIRTIVYTLHNLKTSVSAEPTFVFSVEQFRDLKVAIELITAMGIIPGLLPGVGLDMARLCPRALQISKENLTDMQKYKRQTSTVMSLMDLYNEIMFRPAIIAQIGPLLAALLQLGYAPLAKPSDTNENTGTFRMTTELYEQLKKDQEKFVSLLRRLLNLCPMSTCMKELMIILGIKGAPKWLQRETRRHLVEQIMQPNGIISIIAATCEDMLDFGEHWDKLDTVSRLIVTSHGKSPDEYYAAICPQILDLLASKHLNHSSTIANCCITALYNYKPDVCVKNIIEKICSPLLVHSRKVQDTVISENETEECIENLMKCFIITEAKFKHLPCKVLSQIVIPVFCLYNDVRSSVCILKSKIKQLLLRLLNEESQKNQLFAEILGHELTHHFGHHVISRFGPTGGIEIVGIDETLNYEQFTDSLLDLISTSKELSAALFSYLLQFLSKSMKPDNDKRTHTLLETENDTIEKIQKQLLSVKLLSCLSNIPAVQETQIESPEAIFSFIKSLFNEHIKEGENSLPEKDDCEILYVCLMLIKMILSERKRPLHSPAFKEFKLFLKERSTVPNIPMQLLLLMKEIIELIESQGQSEWKSYQDLSVERKTTKKFEEALRDLTDPLLPVHAHGLIVLTKLIDARDPCAMARKAVVLQIFKENLKHEDSFIYLAAINGLCALATLYPQVVIETLVQEYIDMAQRTLTSEITVETRTKLGEILVKVTRGLGEMATVYKNILVNGFLCAVRDSDSLVRSSGLSCLGELCKVLGYRLGDIVIEVIYCISCIIKTDKVLECRRAAVMVSTLLLRGLGKDTLTSLGKDLVDLYRGLKHLRDNDDDPVLRLHAQLSLEELNEIVRDYLFSPQKLEKRIFLLGGS